MKIRYTHAHGVSVTGLPKGDPLALHAAEAYGYTLNTDARRGRWHSPREFAQAIRETVDCEENPQNAAIATHLEALTV